MTKLAIAAACLLGLSACSYSQRDVALVPAERQVVTVPAPVTGTTVYRSYEVYEDDDPWMPY